MSNPINLPRSALLAGLALVLAAYSLGWSGTLHYDDAPSLSDLGAITGLESALRFVVQGGAGPTGRPLSLAAFALQHGSWPEPRPFLIVNTVLHLVNGLLCYLLVGRLLRWFVGDRRYAAWLAVVIALLWTASPFLASANLMIVQRMTGLSATFSLLFLWLYVARREGYAPDAPWSNVGLAVLAGFGTVLAGLAKENGFLLPVFLLLVETLLVPAAATRLAPANRAYLLVVLALPSAAIIAYLVYRGVVPSGGYAFRDWDVGERLLTQPRVLFDYLRQLLLPSPGAVTPFHDDFRPSRGLLSPPSTLPAGLALGAAAALAWILRRRLPLVSFGLLFFLAGHLVESSTLPLELYYPHRNYLPAVGLYLALACGVFRLARSDRGRRRLALAGGAAYFLVFVSVLAAGSSLWGDRELAPRIWSIDRPESLRAALHFRAFLAANNGPETADRFTTSLIEQHRDDPLPAVLALTVCNPSAASYRAKLDRAVVALEGAPIIRLNAASLLQQLAGATNACEHLAPADVARLVAAVARNRAARVQSSARVALLFAEAQLALAQQRYGQAIDRLEASLALRPTLDAALLIASFHVADGNPGAARAFVRSILADPPVGFPARYAWASRLGEVLASLETADGP